MLNFFCFYVGYKAACIRVTFFFHISVSRNHTKSRTLLFHLFSVLTNIKTLAYSWVLIFFSFLWLIVCFWYQVIHWRIQSYICYTVIQLHIIHVFSHPPQFFKLEKIFFEIIIWIFFSPASISVHGFLWFNLMNMWTFFQY